MKVLARGNILRWLCYNGGQSVPSARRVSERAICSRPAARLGPYSARSSMSRYSAITGWGMYVPEQTLTNADLERMVETSDEWITSRTGIKQRHFARPDETASSLALPAARQALERAGIEGKDLDLIIIATVSQDYKFPSTANLVQHALGA